MCNLLENNKYIHIVYEYIQYGLAVYEIVFNILLVHITKVKLLTIQTFHIHRNYFFLSYLPINFLVTYVVCDDTHNATPMSRCYLAPLRLKYWVLSHSKFVPQADASSAQECFFLFPQSS